MKEKILFDTDIGGDIDDALALAYLLCEPRCDLLGVTTVTGEPHLRAEMVSAVCRNVGRDDVPIHVGCPLPMMIAQRQVEAHQAAKLGDWPRKKFTTDNTAIAFLRDTIRANPGEVTLLGVGPLTNIALLFTLDPELPALLKRLVLMCGLFYNSMGGEWNAILDPHATGIVYGHSTHTRPPQHVSYGIDVTMQVKIHRDDAPARFAGKKVLEPVRDFAEVWFSRCEHAIFHDPLAAVGIFHPDVCTYEKANVQVPLDGSTAGWTVPAPHAQGAHSIARTVDAQKFFDIYFETVK